MRSVACMTGCEKQRLLQTRASTFLRSFNESRGKSNRRATQRPTLRQNVTLHVHDVTVHSRWSGKGGTKERAFPSFKGSTINNSQQANSPASSHDSHCDSPGSTQMCCAPSKAEVPTRHNTKIQATSLYLTAALHQMNHCPCFCSLQLREGRNHDVERTQNITTHASLRAQHS